MSDESARRAQSQIEREIAEADTLRARHQAVLDRMWLQQRQAAAEEARLKKSLDPFNLHLYD